MEITSGECDDGIDPIVNCITIASACNLVFRKNILEPEMIGIIPTHGYRPEENKYIKALRWITYMETTTEIHIQHARNGGEKKIGEYVQTVIMNAKMELKLCSNTMVVFGTVA
jgi:hypothetical protein